MPTKAKELKELIGDPAEVDRKLASYRRAAAVLSSEHARLVEKYPRQWVAFYDGDVRASARTLDELLAKVDEARLPRQEVLIRFIDRNERTMILSTRC